MQTNIFFFFSIQIPGAVPLLFLIGEAAFGTIDSWLIFKLTGGQAHVTDMTNASRTLMYDITHKKWSEKLFLSIWYHYLLYHQVFYYPSPEKDSTPNRKLLGRHALGT